MTTSTNPTSGRSHACEGLLLCLGRGIAAFAVVARATALERIVVARDVQASHARDKRPVAPVGTQATAAREHDRTGSHQLTRERVGVVVAADEHEWLPDPSDATYELRLQRRTARRQVADEEQRSAPYGLPQRGQRQEVVVQVRCDADPGQRIERRALRRQRDHPRQPDELVVELLRKRLCRVVGPLDRPQSHRDVRPVGVVLRMAEAAAGRQQRREDRGCRDRRDAGRADEHAQARSRAAAYGEGHERPRNDSGTAHDEQQQADIGGECVPRLAPDRRQVEPVPRRNATRGLAVDRANVQAQTHGRAHRAEAQAPVQKRHIEVQCAIASGLRRQADAPDAQLALDAERVQRDGPAGKRGEHDDHHRKTAPDPHPFKVRAVRFRGARLYANIRSAATTRSPARPSP
jgi:hypothetical protein